MSNNSKAYINQSINGQLIPMAVINSCIMKALNKMVKESYDAFNISSYERPHPVIRHRSKVDTFEYSLWGPVDDKYVEHFSAKFPIFCSPEDSEGWPKMEFKVKDGMDEPPHACRFMSINTNLNCDAVHYTEVDNSSDSYMVISMGIGGNGSEIVRQVAQALKNEFDMKVLYMSEDEAEPIELESEISPILISA